MAVRAQKCPFCSKPVEIIKEDALPEFKIIIFKLKCGHNLTEELVAQQHEPLIPCICNHFFKDHTSDGKSCHKCICTNFTPKLPRDEVWTKAWPFQQEGVEFLEKANFNALLADEMGVGKTIQSLLALRYNWESLTPCVITCKSSITYNWLREYMKWVCDIWPDDGKTQNRVEEKDLPTEKVPCYYNDGTLPLIPGFKVYIIPYGLLSRPQVLESLRDKIKPKLFIGDEVHNFKNSKSQRTQALYDCLDGVVRDPKTKQILEHRHRVEHRIMLSGTPVVNRLFEYFPILNIIKPIHFSNIKSFAARWVDYDPRTKKWLGLKPTAKNAFFEMTKGYVIRRTRELLDLPKRMPDATIYTDDFQSDYAKLYNKTLDDLEEIIENAKHNARAGDMILGIMSRLRHLAGLLKIKAAVSWANELLTETEEKLLIGIHHKDVANFLAGALAEWNPIMISGDDDAIGKDKKVQQSKNPANRLVIGNIEACGEGINGLQETINNCLILERGWSPSREDQFIGRLDRPGQKLSVFVTYLIAAKTLDDFFYDLIQFKRNVVSDVTKLDFTLDRDVMKQLALRVISSRLRVVGV